MCHYLMAWTKLLIINFSQITIHRLFLYRKPNNSMT